MRLPVFRGTLVRDGAASVNAVMRRNGLTVALCNDQTHQRFHKACVDLGREKGVQSPAQQGLRYYRQQHTGPDRDDFFAWTERVQREDLPDAGTRIA